MKNVQGVISSLGVGKYYFPELESSWKMGESKKSEKSHFLMKTLIFRENGGNKQSLAFLRSRTPKAPKIP